MSERGRYWTEQLAAWERSGLSQAEFCRRYGIKRVTLGWWKRQRRRSSGGTSKRRRRAVEVSKSFVELTGPVRFSAPTYEVVLAGDRLPPGTPATRNSYGVNPRNSRHDSQAWR